MIKESNPTAYLLTVWPWNLMYAALLTLASEGEMQATTDVTYRIYLPGFQKVYNELTERERAVLEARYQGCKTYEQCGKSMGVTRERIRQIEAKAMRKLRGRSARMVMRPPEEYIRMEQRALRAEEESEAYRNRMKKLRKVLGCPDNGEMPKEEPEEEPEEVRPNIMEADIADLELSVRSYNCLYRAGIRTIGDLRGMTIESLCRVRNMGRKSVMEVCDRVKAFGIVIPHEEEAQ